MLYLISVGEKFEGTDIQPVAVVTQSPLLLRFLRQSGSQTVKTCLSSEEKQKMAASCGQVQPPSSTLLISVRRKRDERRPGIVLHRR
ncbi:hypothetical protein ANTRET_LOCUS5083 [Anthophora retusa]